MTSLNELRAREEGSGLSTAEKERERRQGLASSKALEFGGVGGMSGDVLGAWWCYRCGRSTSFVVDLTDFFLCVYRDTCEHDHKDDFPLAWGFVSLGVTRGVESDMRECEIGNSLLYHEPPSKF